MNKYCKSPTVPRPVHKHALRRNFSKVVFAGGVLCCCCSAVMMLSWRALSRTQNLKGHHDQQMSRRKAPRASAARQSCGDLSQPKNRIFVDPRLSRNVIPCVCSFVFYTLFAMCAHDTRPADLLARRKYFSRLVSPRFTLFSVSQYCRTAVTAIRAILLINKSRK